MFSNGNSFFNIFIILSVLKCVVNVPIYNQNTVEILRRYGYLTQEQTVDHIKKDVLNKAIRSFQWNAGLDVTGNLDDATVKTLSTPRCGVLDTIDTDLRIKRYVISGRPMSRQNVTYRITQYSNSLDNLVVDELITKAFNIWSRHTNLNFIRSRYDDLDIEIRFEEGVHDDFSFRDNLVVSFDGPGGTLAHSYLDYNGVMQIHFDDKENWAVYNQPGTSFLQIATHEIGHALGLDHSQTHDAIMYPYYYKRYEPTLDLHSDDIDGIQSIYGKRIVLLEKENKNITKTPINPFKKLVDDFFKSKNREIHPTEATSTIQMSTMLTTTIKTDFEINKKLHTHTKHTNDIDSTTSGKNHANWFDEYEFTINIPASNYEDVEITDNKPSRSWLNGHDEDEDDVSLFRNANDGHEQTLFRFGGFQSISEEVDKFFNNGRKRLFDNDLSLRYRRRWNNNVNENSNKYRKASEPGDRTVLITLW